MKKKSRIYTAREDFPTYQKGIDQMTWDEIISQHGKPMSKDDVLKQVKADSNK
jgi:hypothetical protein